MFFLPLYPYAYLHSQHTHPCTHPQADTPFSHMVKEFVLHFAGSCEEVPEKGHGIMKVIFKRITPAALCGLA